MKYAGNLSHAEPIRQSTPMSLKKKSARVLKIIEDVGASYWFVPGVLVIAAITLAIATVLADLNFTIMATVLPDTVTNISADGARSVLAVLAQSIIGVTGVMFSMTLVAVSFASGNFGPRLIGNFMRDRGNQWSLGILISTFVYTVVVLRSVDDGSGVTASVFVPHVGFIVAMMLSLICVFTIIFFIHHVPETINVSRISASLSIRLERQLQAIIDDQDDALTETVNWPDGAADVQIMSDKSGYIQTCEFEDLLTMIKANGWHISIIAAVGDFVTRSTPLLEVWMNESLTDDEIESLRSTFVIGPERTEHHNPTFLTQQLVEMAIRALSPGINDPYTAMDCLNRLAAALTVAAHYKEGLQPVEHRALRRKQLDFATLFDFTFPLCRQYVLLDDLTRKHAQDLLTALIDTLHADDKVVVAKELEQLALD